MNKSKDPFEAALEEQEDSPPDSPIAQDELDTQTPIQTQNQAPAGRNILFDDDDYDEPSTDVTNPSHPAILSQFTEDQMSRYESFRRSALQKSNMRRFCRGMQLLVSITGSQKVSLPMTIVVCGIAKMFVGELVETARMVMTERKESGPIRPCHIREAYRRLKLEGKIPKRSVQRLFR
ncbi:TAFII28-like protein [Corchorus olitorius]|uniref:TAFII28-like protein n=1 Tax=Corchorus olitorius TaxID=93759 RepID=A0A1R3K8Y5_9ROSI|nr:TAFII28-like protein [Corchorus olitorius]